MIPQSENESSVHSFNISRRAFLRRCSTVAAMTGLPLWFVERQQLLAAEVDAKPASTSANDKPGIALIGCGGMGTWDGQNAGNHGNIVAVCDVDSTHSAA